MTQKEVSRITPFTSFKLLCFPFQRTSQYPPAAEYSIRKMGAVTSAVIASVHGLSISKIHFFAMEHW
jgi:hypothetical protein